jgi:hypothetical protein
LNDSFVEWRYCHETDQTGAVTVQPTIVVMKAVHEACKELGALEASAKETTMNVPPRCGENVGG